MTGANMGALRRIGSELRIVIFLTKVGIGRGADE